MHPNQLRLAVVVVLVCSSVFAGAAAAQDATTAEPTTTETTTAEPTTTETTTAEPTTSEPTAGERPDADPMGLTDSPVPGFGAVTAVLALTVAALAARAVAR
jgi:PGF-CTERM protein